MRLACECEGLAEWHDVVEKRGQEARLLATFGFLDLDRSGTRTRFPSADRVVCNYPELIIRPLNEINRGKLALDDIVIVALDPCSSADLPFFNNVSLNLGATICRGWVPFEIHVALANLFDCRCTRTSRHFRSSFQMECCRVRRRLAETSSILGPDSELVRVTQSQSVHQVGSVLDQIVLNCSPRCVVIVIPVNNKIP